CAPFNPIGLSPARTSWSNSARLAARAAGQTPARSIGEMVPALYHRYLCMFQKSAAKGLPPRTVLFDLSDPFYGLFIIY
ncbi:uncharacterized protein VP01_1931g6, partial [Puccinia sorghi]